MLNKGIPIIYSKYIYSHNQATSMLPVIYLPQTSSNKKVLSEFLKERSNQQLYPAMMSMNHINDQYGMNIWVYNSDTLTLEVPN